PAPVGLPHPAAPSARPTSSTTGIVLIATQTITILVCLSRTVTICTSMAEAQISWGELALEELRRAGYRAGAARLGVISFLETQSCCLGAQEIHDHLCGAG